MSNSAQLQTDVTTTLMWLAVFLVGFGAGYAGMTFIGEPAAQATDPGPAESERQQVSDEPTELPPLDLVTPEAPEVAPPPAIKEPQVQAVADVPTPKLTEPPTPIEGDLHPEAAEAKSPSSQVQPWWQVCQNGRRCRLDFGSIEGNLSIRKASITHGQVVDWSADLAGKPREDTLVTDRPLEVQVEAIGFNAAGKPVAAEIVLDKGNRVARGVISLDLGQPGKRIVMKP